MLKANILNLLNLALRGIGIFSKFLLMIYIIKYLSTADLGVFGLFNTTILLAIQLLGLDFYTFNTREFLAFPLHERFPFIRDQFVFHSITYILTLPFFLLIFIYDVLPKNYIAVFYLILIFEHLSQEFYRLFTAFSMPIFANLLLFFRSGIWVYVVLILWWAGFENLKNLNTIWMAWLVGSFISVLISIIYLWRIYNSLQIIAPINWQWLRKGAGVSLYFFACTIAFKIIELSDRYMIDYFLSKTELGIYTFFVNIANILNTIVFTLVIMVEYPKLVSQKEQGKWEELQDTKKKFLKKTVLLTLIFAMIIALLIYPINWYLKKDFFFENIFSYYVLLFANIVLNISYVFQYFLYIEKKDKVILKITLMGAVANICINLTLIPVSGILGAAIATALSYLSILILEYKYAK